MIGTTLGPYELLAELGSGGMGTVYRASGPAGVVAVKVVHAHLLSDPRFAARFRREVEIGRCVSHENVVRTLDAGTAEVSGRTHSYLVMEFVEGQTLRDLLAELRVVPEQLCRHVGREVARGLAAIHGVGAVHRDLKPENVLVTRSHVVKVMDLGIARLADEAVRLSSTGTFVGSVRYAAPEQFRSPDDVDPRADLWALGVVLYELATGVHPFDAADFRAAIRRILDEEPRRLGDAAPQSSPLLEELVAQLLRKDRDRRLATAAELAAILGAGEDGTWWRSRAAWIRTATCRPLRRIRIPRETSLQGRAAEIERLGALFDAASAGDGRVALIEGEAGIGKSRLVDEFVVGLERGGAEFEFLAGGYPPGGAASASGAFVTAYREHFDERGLERALRESLPEMPLLVPAFAALLRGDAPPPGAEALTPESAAAAFVHCTRTLAARRTVVVLIDDLHFAPEGGLALFAALAAAAAGHRILLLGTTRPGLDAEWVAQLDRAPHVVCMPLARLGAVELSRLLAEAFRGERLAEDVASRIATKSDGNPFFVFEILESLRERGALVRREDGVWRASSPEAPIAVPSSVREIVEARLAALDDEDRDLLQAAACQGFEFDAPLVAEALGLPLFPTLKRFARIEREHRLVRAVGRVHAFDHHQVQEILYEGLFEQLREQYHAAIGAALEARTGGDGPAPSGADGIHAVALAEQFLLGGRGERALKHVGAALDQLERSFLHDRAAGLAGRVLAVPRLVRGADRVRLLLRRAAAFAVGGHDADERAALESALELTDGGGADTGDADSLRALVRAALGEHLLRRGDLDDAERVLHEGLELADVAGAAAAEAAIRSHLAGVAFERGRDADVATACDDVVRLARVAGDARLELLAGQQRAQAAMRAGRDDEARALLAEVVRSAGRSGAWDVGLRAAASLAVVHMERGLLADAGEGLDQAVDLARRTGRRPWEAAFRASRTLLLSLLGDNAAAEREGAAALALARETVSPRAEAHALHVLATVAAHRGDDVQAADRIAASAALRRRHGFRAELLWSLCKLARIRTDEGLAEVAAALLDEAQTLALDTGLAIGEAAVAVHRARLPGGDAHRAAALLDARRTEIDVADLLDLRWRLWQASRDPHQLAEARRLLAHLVRHAPPERRAAMTAGVRVFRDVGSAPD